MKKILLLSIFSLALASFHGCSKDKNEEIVNPIESEFFKVQGSSFRKGQFPASTVSQTIGTVGMNRNAIPGGSSSITVAAPEPMKEFYLGVYGMSGYTVVPAVSGSSATEYGILLLFSQNLGDSFTLLISGKTSGGKVCQQVSEEINRIEVGTGALQISLSFNNDKDVDLYVVRPGGEVICYDNEGGEDDEGNVWGLDLDSNPDCRIDGKNNENIFFPTSELLSGKYEVWVNMYSNCDPDIATTWAVTATLNGAFITPASGNNPATGIFPAGTVSNYIGSELTGATKVMEFNVTGAGSHSAVSGCTPRPKTQSALRKEHKASLAR